MSAANTITEFSQKMTAIFAPDNLRQQARSTGFINRCRQVEAHSLVHAFLKVLGERQLANLADIHRTFCSVGKRDIQYKPFNNQLKKTEMTELFQSLVKAVLEKWFCEQAPSLPSNLPFTHIMPHDGSSLKLHDNLAHIYPGRFTATHPAAVELHVSFELLSGRADYLAITPDKESERDYQFIPQELKGMLALEDAGYFDINYCHQIDQAGGSYIIRASNSIQPVIHQAYKENGTRIKGLKGKKQASLKLEKHDIADLDVTWDKHPGQYRLIAFWDKRKSRLGYLITNLKRGRVQRPTGVAALQPALADRDLPAILPPYRFFMCHFLLIIHSRTGFFKPCLTRLAQAQLGT